LCCDVRDRDRLLLVLVLLYLLSFAPALSLLLYDLRVYEIHARYELYGQCSDFESTRIQKQHDEVKRSAKTVRRSAKTCHPSHRGLSNRLKPSSSESKSMEERKKTETKTLKETYERQ
jgi:putative component of membrane protein insertase Oxa1/YidC/SpoIIIJ protein YidD